MSFRLTLATLVLIAPLAAARAQDATHDSNMQKSGMSDTGMSHGSTMSGGMHAKQHGSMGSNAMSAHAMAHGDTMAHGGTMAPSSDTTPHS